MSSFFCDFIWIVTLWFFEKRRFVRAKCFQGPGSRQRRDWNHKALISLWRGRGRYPPPPRSETSFDLRVQDTNRPTDASGAFRSGPRAPTKAVTPFFQNSKLMRFLQKSLGPSFRRKPESSYFKMFWTPAFAGVTLQETFYEIIKISNRSSFSPILQFS